MLVKAAPGLKVPMEAKPRQYITEDAPPDGHIDVPESAYYLRRLDEGDLVRAEAAATAKPAKSATAKSATEE